MLTTLPSIVAAVATQIIGIASVVSGFLTTMVATIGQVMSVLVITLSTALAPLIILVTAAAIAGLIGAIGGAITYIAHLAIDLFKATAAAVKNSAMAIGNTVVNAVSNVSSSIAATAWRGAAAGMDALTAFSRQSIAFIMTLRAPFERLWAYMKQTAGEVKETFAVVMDAIKAGDIEGAMETVWAELQLRFTDMQIYALKLFDVLRNNLPGILSTVAEGFASAFEIVKKIAIDLWEELQENAGLVLSLIMREFAKVKAFADYISSSPFSWRSNNIKRSGETIENANNLFCLLTRICG